MKLLSKALLAMSLFSAAAAADAQYFQTNFDGNDGVTYNTTAPLNNQGGFTSTTANDPNSSPLSPAAVVINNGAPFNNQGSLAANTGGATGFVSHALAQATVGGFVFNTDFSIQDYTAGTSPNAYAFTFSSTGGNVFGVTFTPSGTPHGAPAIGLTLYGTTVLGNFTATPGGAPNTTYNTATGPSNTFTADTPGADLGSYYHLTVAVSPAGGITVTYAGLKADGTLNTSFVSATPSATDTFAATGITGLSVNETNGGLNPAGDYITFDNVTVSIPEPSTYAMMGLGLLGTVSMMKFRRKA